jgi:F-type H+-transporting ATPase subunit a
MCKSLIISRLQSFLLSLSVLVLFATNRVVAHADHDTSAHHHAVMSETQEASHGHHHESVHSEEKFNAGKLILEHIVDAHDWHLFGHYSIPLPVIIYTPGLGLDVFLSSAFNHGHDDVNTGKQTYRLHENKVVVVNADGDIDEVRTAAIYDISITKNVASLFVGIIILLLVFFNVAKAYTSKPNTKPSGLQSLIEPIIIFIRDDVAKASIGEKKYKKFMPFLLTVFFFIWINNLLGLIPIAPGGANVTGNVAITMTLAVFTFIITIINGNKHYWQHIFAMPGVPKGVLILLTPIEILGMFLRPFVLMVRLFANITAGHIIALSFFSLIFIFGEMNVGAGLGFSIFSTLFTVFMMVLELLVSFLQAYVFTLLSAVYFGSAVEEAHHDDHH